MKASAVLEGVAFRYISNDYVLDSRERSRARAYKLPRIRKVLTESEGRWLIRQLVPESVAATRMTELRGDQAGEGRPEHATRERSLGHTARPQIDVRRMSEK